MYYHGLYVDIPPKPYVLIGGAGPRVCAAGIKDAMLGCEGYQP